MQRVFDDIEREESEAVWLLTVWLEENHPLEALYDLFKRGKRPDGFPAKCLEVTKHTVEEYRTALGYAICIKAFTYRKELMNGG